MKKVILLIVLAFSLSTNAQEKTNLSKTDDALSKAVEKGIELAEKTGNFVIEQAPDLLKEFYIWHIVQNALGMLGGLFLCFIAYKIIKLTGDDESNYMTDCEIFGKHIGFGTILISGFFSIGGIVFIMTSIYGLVFIIVAPKLYLIEYFIR